MIDFGDSPFEGLIAGIQLADLQADQKRREEERRQIDALRKAHDPDGLSATELLQKLAGDNDDEKREKLNAQLDQMNKEAREAAKAKEKQDEQPTNHHPEPVLNFGID